MRSSASVRARAPPLLPAVRVPPLAIILVGPARNRTETALIASMEEQKKRRTRRRHRFGARSDGASGIVKQNVVPNPTLLSTQIRPQ
jgi:hypothetical protein